jgi:ribosome maturation factor RimP
MDREFIASLWEQIEPILEPDGFELIDLEFKFEGGRRVLRLYIDTAGGVTLDHCQLVSKQVGALLDMKDPIDNPYHLEVSSPGINRVLKKKTDFVKFAGAEVKIKTRNKFYGRRNFHGTLTGMENSIIILEVDGQRVDIPYSDLEKARLNLSEEDLFRRDLQKGAP